MTASNYNGLIRLKFSYQSCLIFILLVAFTPCFIIGHEYKFSENHYLITNVTTAIGNRYNTRCVNVMHPSNVSSNEYRQIFNVVRKLAMDSTFRQPILVTSFKKFLNIRRNLTKDMRCPKLLFIVLGWIEDTREEFSEFSFTAFIPGSIWLVFLASNTSTHYFLKDANTPFNMDILTATLQNNQTVLLEEAYRVDPKYPLRVRKYGSWEDKKFTAPPALSTHSRRRDLEGLPVRASTKDDYPLCFLKRNEKNQLEIGGYFGLVYYELAKNLNFTPVYVPAKENVTGAVINGKWNGLLGMIQRNEIDLSVGPQALDLKVMSVASFVWPLFKTSFTLFFKETDKPPEFDDILKPFAMYIWILIITWLAISAIMMNRFYNWGCNFGQEDCLYKIEFTAMNSFFTTLKALCQQGHPFTPNSWPCRITYITGYVLSTVLVTAYSGSLISNLAAGVSPAPFDSLETFLKDGTYKLIAIGSSTDYVYFSGATDPLRKEIYERFMKPTPDSASITNKEGGLDILCEKEKYAFFITYDIPAITAEQYSEDSSKNCVITHLKTHLDTIFLSVARRKDLAYADLINFEVLRMFSYGIAQKLYKQAWPLKKSSSVKTKMFAQVNFEQVLQIHLILLFGAGLSVFILLVEIFIRRQQLEFIQKRD